jgi:hypothetical protein
LLLLLLLLVLRHLQTEQKQRGTKAVEIEEELSPQPSSLCRLRKKG